jgi:hypothetical protein
MGKYLRILFYFLSVLYIRRIGPHIFYCSRIGRPILEIYNYLTCQMYECGNLETEHYNSVLEIRRLHSFISGNTYSKWEPGIFILDSHRPFICCESMGFFTPDFFTHTPAREMSVSKTKQEKIPICPET